ncbi:hypothetical protein DL98DRAFT_660911 [Cadophora sp. DSE1049]|nr:hypothetical protein DL98DRAFT_660911 [Cadophora sp. DSE1049]
MPPKPRRRPKTESQEEYEARVKEWEAIRPHKVEKEVTGNHMTQTYYTARLLPVYIKAVQEQRLQHTIRYIFKKMGILLMACSPGLNPTEGIWNIIMQRVRHSVFNNDEEVKQALQEE